MTLNSILIRRTNKIAIIGPADVTGFLQPSVVASFNRNLEGLGYTLDQNALTALSAIDMDTASKLMDEVLSILQVIRGVKNYNPMYPNFPTQVMEASDAELYINAIIHYLTAFISDVTGVDQTWLPKYAKDERPSLVDVVKLQPLSLGTKEEAIQLIANIVASNTSISETDKADVTWAESNGYLVLPESVPNKENLAFAIGLLIKSGKLNMTDSLGAVKTATDVLRIAVALSGGDVSLAANTKFRNFSRRERRGLLALLERCGQITEDMLRHAGPWVKLGEKLHPGDFSLRYPRCQTAFDVIRNNTEFATWGGTLEAHIKARRIENAVRYLQGRPGEFARRLDHLLRISPTVSEQDLVVDKFMFAADRVSTPVLLQTMAHFKGRSNPSDLRVFFPKGSLAKVQAIGNTLPEIPEELCKGVVNACKKSLVDRFYTLPPLGKTFVDERMAHYLVPFSQRSATQSMRTLVRGSRIPFDNDDASTVRFFIWWKNIAPSISDWDDTRVDIDLSAVVYDSNWQFKDRLAYFNLRSDTCKGYHSGDITSAPNGACEFIDVDIPSTLRLGRYIIMSVNSFTHQLFSDVPECSAGWMLRQHPKSGEVFEPKTVVDRFDLTSKSQICVPMILDLQERQAIWVDASLKVNESWCNNVYGNANQITKIGTAFTQITKPNLYDLFTMHAMARGELVDNIEEAETIFAPDRGITPFQLELIASEYMKDA